MTEEPSDKTRRAPPPPIPDDPRAIVTQEQVWYWWRLSKEEIREARSRGLLPFRKRGQRIQMRVADVETYVASTITAAPQFVTSYTPPERFDEQDLKDVFKLLP